MADSESLKVGKGEGLTSTAPPYSYKESEGGGVSDEIVCPSGSTLIAM